MLPDEFKYVAIYIPDNQRFEKTLDPLVKDQDMINSKEAFLELIDRWNRVACLRPGGPHWIYYTI